MWIMDTRLRGEIEFEFRFRATQGRSWPRIILLANNMTMGYHDINNQRCSASMVLKDYSWSQGPNNISISYFSKDERDTVVRGGSIVADQSLELISIHADGILLEPWFWTDHCYQPDYFRGFLEKQPDAPRKIKSQLIWHFPGRFTITGLPVWSQFWSWYQSERTSRVIKDLVDPTGQISNNHRGFSDEDRALINDIKETLHV